MLIPQIGNNGISNELNNSMKNDIKELIFNNLQNIKVNYIGEDCNEETTLQEFLQILEDYTFTQDELSKKNKHKFTLRIDSDYYIELTV